MYSIARDVLPRCCLANDIVYEFERLVEKGRPLYLRTRRFEQRTWKEHNAARTESGASSTHD